MAVEAHSVPSPAPRRWRVGRRSLSWTLLAAYVAPLWSLAYGLLALAWALGASGYPYSSLVDPDARLSMLGSVDPQAGATVLVGLSLLGALAGAAMLGGGGRGAVRALAVGVGAVVAITFAVLVPDLRVVVAVAYTPVLLVLALVGWPAGVSLATAFPWPVVHQLILMAGGIAWVGATIRYQRLSTHACERCGRRQGTGREREVAWAEVWGRRAVGLAVAIPLIYVATRWAWAFGVPLGMTAEALRDYTGNQRLGGVMLASVAAAGALLTTGLALPWGEGFPTWVPVIGKRWIPPNLAIAPASLMTVVLLSSGLSFVRGVIVGDLPFELDNWGVVGPTLLWPVWGAALGVATLAYSYGRRGKCRTCGRGQEASPPSSASP